MTLRLDKRLQWPQAIALLLFALPLIAHAQESERARCPRNESARQCYGRAVELARAALDTASERTAASPALARAVEMLRETCQRGSGEACSLGGQLMLVRAMRAAVDSAGPDSEAEQQSAFLFERGCLDARRGEACTALGRAYAIGIGRPINADTAIRLFLRGCELGDATACFRATSRWVEEALLRLPRTQREASLDSLTRRACELGSPGGCYNAAFFLQRRLEKLPLHEQRGPEYAANGRRVLKAYARSCAVGDFHSCASAGVLHRDGEIGIPRNVDSAEFYFRTACPEVSNTLSTGYGCQMLGHFVFDHESDTTGALALFLKGCQIADADACGTYAQKGFEWGRVRDAALDIAIRGCSELSGHSCWVVGWLYEQETFRDWARAQTHYERACALREPYGCTGLADMFIAGRATSPWIPDSAASAAAPAVRARAQAASRMLAAKYFQRACALESGPGCRETGTFLEVEYPHVSDPLHYFALACDYGDAEGCWQAMRMSAGVGGSSVDEGTFRSRACGLDSSYCKKNFSFTYRSPG